MAWGGPQTLARTSYNVPATRAVHYVHPDPTIGKRTLKGPFLAIFSCSGAVFEGFLDENQCPRHLEAHNSSNYPLGRPLEPSELL